MKLRKLKIARFKNLRDFEIDFGVNPLTTVLLGQNGTGKSNLLEALIIIFRDLDLGEVSEFKYSLEYECRQRTIRVDADAARGKTKRQQVLITVRDHDGSDKAVPYNHQFYEDSERKYLPSYVFGYYSGPSNRMEKHFSKHQERFYRDLLDGKKHARRPLLYTRLVHGQFALLSFFTTEDQGILAFLQKHMGIDGLASVLFIMREPPWHSKGGDARFWNARGTAKDFLVKLYELAFAPMWLDVRIEPEFANKKKAEHLYLYLPGVKELRSLAGHYDNDQQEFFKALESTYLSKMLSEVRIELQVQNADGSLTFRDLSEGEQQLLMVLGLLRFTKEDEALFLLDEPDTHLNPAWSVQYLEFMEEVVANPQSSHVVMTTHNPLVISSLQREDVRIMQRRKTGIFVEQPRENPQGMGVNSILTSEMFGLRTALDSHTQGLLDKQQALIVKDDLTDTEREQLGELNDRLDALGFTTAEDDPRYAEFLTRLYKRRDPAFQGSVVLTPEQQEEHRDLMDEIIDEMIAEGRWV